MKHDQISRTTVVTMFDGQRDASRERAYRAVDSERDYQDRGMGNAERHDGGTPVMPVAEYILYMEKCLQDARAACYRGRTGARDALDFIRKVTALGVSCMEKHGAPERPLGGGVS